MGLRRMPLVHTYSSISFTAMVDFQLYIAGIIYCRKHQTLVQGLKLCICITCNEQCSEEYIVYVCEFTVLFVLPYKVFMHVHAYKMIG